MKNTPACHPGRKYYAKELCVNCYDSKRHARYKAAGKRDRRGYYQLNKKRAYERNRSNRLKREYGITLEQYDAIFALQGGVCAVCKQPPKIQKLHVDHDHHDGRVRGLLCYFCNRRVVGRLTLENARKVVAYLEKDFDGRQIEA